MKPENIRRAAWTPPRRPDWVARINEEGSCLDIKSIVPLDAQSLVATAMANTGLSNFGSEDWREPFEIICRALDEEAELNLMGRIMTRSDMLMLLEARLKVEEAYLRHPEIDDEEIKAPILIVGQGRSGTTALFNLMALDPDTEVVRVWQGLFPAPQGKEDEIDRIMSIADRRMGMWSRVTPEIDVIHDFSARTPTESIHLQSLSFQMPSWQVLYGQTPSHYQFMNDRSYVPAISYEKRVLKLLQWRKPKKRWLLKSADALNYLPDVIKVFPDIGFVWAHRDPVVAMSSAVNLVGTLAWIRSDKVLTEGTYDTAANPEVCAQKMTLPIEWIESDAIPKRQLCNVQYADFITDPIRTVESIYSHFGLEFTITARSAMSDHVERHPRTARPTHRYDTGTEDIISAERHAFERYEAYFGIPREV